MLVLKNKLIELFREEDSEQGTGRQLPGKYLILVGIVGILWGLFHIYTMGFGTLPGMIQRSIHLFGAIFLCYLLFTSFKKWKNKKWALFADVGLAAVGLVITIYVISVYSRVIENHGVYNSVDVIMGTVLLVLVLEGARRTLGWFIPLLVVAVLIYTFFGPYFPGMWTHPAISYGRFMQVFLLGTQGIWGELMGISTNVLILFVLYGSLILYLGLGDTFFEIGKKLTGKWRGGAAHLSTVTSAFFGTINGSAVANVATTGNFTIPLMKRLGYNKNFAGAVESVASSGGQIMPPVMGAGAFLMAELLGISYTKVMIAALIPALLFFASIMAAIYFYARSQGLQGVPKEEIPTWKEAMYWRKSIPLFVPLVFLVYLMFQGYTAGRAGYVAIVGTVVFYFLCNVTSKAHFKSAIERLVVSLDRGAKSMVTIVMLIAAAQTLVTAINVSGLGVKFSLVTITLSNGNLFIALVLAMIITVISGMGAPTPAAYVLAASVVAPALIGMGIQGLTAHMFLYYFAALAAITPPICAAVYVACGISQGNWVKTAFHAVRLGLVAFIIPYMFVYNPVLLMEGDAFNIILGFVTALFGVCILAVGTMGAMMIRATVPERLLTIIAAFTFIIPGWQTDFVGLVLFIITGLIHWKRVRIQEKILPKEQLSQTDSL
jgi:TRAP transporter 4TM/12TM fusion protein